MLLVVRRRILWLALALLCAAGLATPDVAGGALDQARGRDPDTDGHRSVTAGDGRRAVRVNGDYPNAHQEYLRQARRSQPF